MDLGLAGKKAIVTGGSKGIGRAIADTLAAEGCHVAICARGQAGRGQRRGGAPGQGRQGVRAGARRHRPRGAGRLGRGERRGARRHRHRGRQRQRARHEPHRRGVLGPSSRSTCCTPCARSTPRCPISSAPMRRRHRRDLERLGAGARLHEPGLRHLQGGADPLRLAHGERARAASTSASTRSRPATPISRAASGSGSSATCPTCSRTRSPRTPGAAWRPPRRSRTPRCSSRARPRASPPASTSWSTAR